MAFLLPLYPAPSRHLRRSLVVAAGGFAAFVNIYALQSLLPLLARVFHADRQSISLTISSITLAVALASPLAGWLAGRCRRRPLTLVAVLGLFITGLLAAWAPDLNSLVGCRFLQGLFLPLLVANLMSYIGESGSTCRVGRVMGSYIAWTIVGGFSGRFLGGWMAAQAGWRLALTGLALLNGLAGLIVLAYLPERRDTTPPAAGLGDVRSNLADPCLRAAFVNGFLILFSLVGLFTYITFRLADAPFGMGPDRLGSLFCVYLLGVLVTPWVGRAVPVVGTRRMLRYSGAATVSGLLLTLAPNLEAVLVGLSLFTLGIFASQAATSEYVSRRGGSRRSQALGLYLSCYYFGGCAGGAIPGYCWSLGGWGGCVLLLVCAQLLQLRQAGRLHN